MRTSFQVTQCPACLCMLREYGTDPVQREMRLDPAGIHWCEHHRRASRWLRQELGGPIALGMIVGFEKFALRHQVRQQDGQQQGGQPWER